MQRHPEQIDAQPDRSNRLSVVWTADSISPLATTGDDHDIFYARQIGEPGASVPDSPWVPAIALSGAVAALFAVRRRRGTVLSL